MASFVDEEYGAPLRALQFSHHSLALSRMNNGSFGSAPKDVLVRQREVFDEWLSNPDSFWHSLERRFEDSATSISSALLPGSRPSDVIIVDNLTTAFAILSR